MTNETYQRGLPEGNQTMMQNQAVIDLAAEQERIEESLRKRCERVLIELDLIQPGDLT